MSTPPQPLARGFLMIDGTGSPQTSPIASAGTEASITIPSVAAGVVCFRLNVYAPSFALTLRKIAGGATGGTLTIPAATWFSIPCKGGDVLYFGRGAGSTTIEFLLETYGA